MKEKQSVEEFFHCLMEVLGRDQFISLTLGKKASRLSDLSNIYIKPIKINGISHLSFKFRFENRDQVKNYLFEEGEKEIRNFLGNVFLSANLFTKEEDIQLTLNKKRNASLRRTEASKTIEQINLKHDKKKKRWISSDNIYLKKLGLTDDKGQLLPSRQDKFKQINRYIEVVDHLIDQANLPDELDIVDMGSGKGYLTFALYDHLVNNRRKRVSVTGIELRQNLVDLCNEIAQEARFENLRFISQDIHDYKEKKIDVLIALHACDTATDEAIFKGIGADSGLIICAPCCHKQVRKQMHSTDELQAITQFGIFEERQAEMLTDSIRALLMEANGYQSKVFEFISSEHTRKNVMLTAAKLARPLPSKDSLEKVKKLKATFGLEYHYLEKLLAND